MPSYIYPNDPFLTPSEKQAIVRVSRGVSESDIPDGPIRHAKGCLMHPLHTGDCRVPRPPGHRGPTLDAPVTEMAPTEGE